MAFDFPASPTLNEIYTDGASGNSFQWDGTVWGLIATPEMPRDFVKISSGSISSPVPYFDVALPGAYNSYEFCLANFQTSLGRDIGLIVSFDDGVTWLNDLINGDSYSLQNSTNSAVVISYYNGDDFEHNSATKINPGSALYKFSITMADANGYTGGGVPNPLATNPFSPARTNKIRVGPIPNLTTGTSLVDLLQGSWTLYGVN